MKRVILLTITMLCGSVAISAQDSAQKSLPNPTTLVAKPTEKLAPDLASQSWIKPLKLNFDKTGDRFLQFGGYIQLLASGWQNNPGTTVQGNGRNINKPYDYNVGLRRLRLVFNATFSPRWTALFSFGMNNFYATTIPQSTPAPQVLDAMINFKALESLNIAFGMSQDGFTRLSSYSAPGAIFDDEGMATPEANIIDNTLRQWGLFINGNIKRFNYRTAFTKPFLMNGTTYGNPLGLTQNSIGAYTASMAPNGKQSALMAYNPSSIEMKGYFTWNFWDIDPSGIPGIALKTNNLGTKKIFNLGVGIMYRHKATGILNNPLNTNTTTAPTDVKYYNNLNFSADFLLDLPFSKQQNEVLTIYSIFVNYNYGPNFLRTSGMYNIAPGYYNPNISSLYTGNIEPMYGTGSIWETQVAYLLPKNWWFKKAGQIQLGAFYSLVDLEAFNHHVMHKIDAILNFYFTSNLKIGLAYHARPLFNKNTTDLNAQTIQKGFGNQLSLMAQFQW